MATHSNSVPCNNYSFNASLKGYGKPNEETNPKGLGFDNNLITEDERGIRHGNSN